MATAQPPRQRPHPPVEEAVVSDQQDALLSWPLQRPALAVWQRCPPKNVTAAAERLAEVRQAAEYRFNWRPDTGPMDFIEVFSKLDRHLSLPALHALSDDAHTLMNLAARLAKSLQPELNADELGVRIERVIGDGCRLFHVDRLSARLICTWTGPGTEWLPEGSFDRAGLGCGCNDHVLDPDASRQIPTGAVALLRGDLCRGHEGGGLVHRSPPAQAGVRRVLMAVDFR
ncbi:MAG: DUF1826 domain-containing protein [Wenzhouxiangella sp.]|nr:MAG: DUF1826 domain-containing protein [Wenzhouxiangella sp.]